MSVLQVYGVFSYIRLPGKMLHFWDMQLRITPFRVSVCHAVVKQTKQIRNNVLYVQLVT